MKRIGVYGGSFDPVHMGHLLLAEYCRVECKLDQVQFVPASVSPHKTEDAPASGKDRVEMLQLAIGGNSAFELNDLELQRGGVSYTVDTVTQIQQQHEDAELFLMMGADSLVDFPSWRDPAGICRFRDVA